MPHRKRFTSGAYSGQALDVLRRCSEPPCSSRPWVLPMLLQIYSHRCLPWLIISGQPSHEAVSYGALRLEGSFQADRLTDSERRVVLREISALSYARVPAVTALRLMGPSSTRQVNRRLSRWLPTRLTALFRA